MEPIIFGVIWLGVWGYFLARARDTAEWEHELLRDRFPRLFRSTRSLARVEATVRSVYLSAMAIGVGVVVVGILRLF